MPEFPHLRAWHDVLEGSIKIKLAVKDSLECQFFLLVKEITRKSEVI